MPPKRNDSDDRKPGKPRVQLRLVPAPHSALVAQLRLVGAWAIAMADGIERGENSDPKWIAALQRRANRMQLDLQGLDVPDDVWAAIVNVVREDGRMMHDAPEAQRLTIEQRTDQTLAFVDACFPIIKGVLDRSAMQRAIEAHAHRGGRGNKKAMSRDAALIALLMPLPNAPRTAGSLRERFNKTRFTKRDPKP